MGPDVTTELNIGVLETFHGKIMTAELADILEAKYALFSQFVDLEFDFIEEALLEDYEGQLNAILNGHPVAGQPYQQASGKIAARFRRFLDTEEIAQSGVPGVPTEAALLGKSSRLKSKKGARRPSFIDTSVLYASLIAWVETNQ